MRAVRRTWTIGGAALVATGVLGMLWATAPGFGALYYVVDILFAAAVLFFAIGLSREASVVARRPLGVAALAVLALWPFVTSAVEPFLPRMDQAAFEAGLDTYRAAEAAGTALFVTDLLVSLVAAIIAVVQIARAGTVPPPWRWAPLWTLAVEVLSVVLPQALFAVIIGTPTGASVFILISQLGFLARTLGLGILALVLAARVRPRSVDVIRSGGT